MPVSAVLASNEVMLTLRPGGELSITLFLTTEPLIFTMILLND